MIFGNSEQRLNEGNHEFSDDEKQSDHQDNSDEENVIELNQQANENDFEDIIFSNKATQNRNIVHRMALT